MSKYSKRDSRAGVRSWAKLLVLLADEILIVALVLVVLWSLGVSLHAGILAAISLTIAAVVFLLHRAIWPSLVNVGSDNPSGMVGLEGEVVEPLSPAGLVRVSGEIWKAVCVNGEAYPGQRVEVTRVERLRLFVKRL